VTNDPATSSLRSWILATAKERHRPPHSFGDGLAVFLSASTLDRYPHLASPQRRTAFAEQLFKHFQEVDIELVAWAVLKEHYHLVAVPKSAELLPSTLQRLHSRSAGDWNREDNTPGRACWYQYCDTTLWTEGDLASRINYIHNNPVKHGYVERAEDWEWSSYRDYVQACLPDTADDLLTRFPAPRRLPRDDF
jgi:putative transposase